MIERSVLAERANRAHDHSFLTAWHKIWATITLRIRSLPLLPGRIISLIVKETFSHSFDFHSVPTPSIDNARRRLYHLPTKS